MHFVLNAGARPVATQKRTKNAPISPFTLNAEPGPGQVVIPSSGIRDARMAYRVLNGNRPRASFTLMAVAYMDSGDHDSVALLQYAESGDACKSSTTSFTARPYSVTSYENEAEKHVMALENLTQDTLPATLMYTFADTGVSAGNATNNSYRFCNNVKRIPTCI
jgi:hypothetical protein